MIMVHADEPGYGSGVMSVVRPHLDFRSRNLDQVHAFMNDKDLCFNVARRNAGALDVHIEGFYLPAGLYVGLTEYGARATVRPNPRRLDYWIQIPVRGQMETTFGSHQYIGDVRRGCILSYPCILPSWSEVDAHAARMTLVLSRESVQQQLALLLGRPLDAVIDPPLEFTPVLDLTCGHGRSIARLSHLAFADFERGGPMMRNPLATSSFEQFILNELLLSHPHNYSDALYGAVASIAPRDVKRATDYIEAHLQAPISLADVVGAAGVPGRTLFKHFEDYRGTSPMEYLRAARFERVREALRRGEEARRISDIAMTWGFSHLGRFSTEYRKRYGERPSQTLKRSRSRR